MRLERKVRIRDLRFLPYNRGRRDFRAAYLGGCETCLIPRLEKDLRQRSPMFSAKSWEVISAESPRRYRRPMFLRSRKERAGEAFDGTERTRSGLVRARA